MIANCDQNSHQSNEMIANCDQNSHQIKF